MDDSHLVSIAQIRGFLKVEDRITFKGKSRDEMYRWIEVKLIQFRYFSCSKKEKGIVKEYLMKMTGYSDAQITRLIKKKKELRVIRIKLGKRNTFKNVYSPADVALLIATDLAHGRLSGPATQKILQRECMMYNKKEFERIQHISSSHIYNLRATRQYRSHIGSFTKTKPTTTPIGKRCKPDNHGTPGYIRVDTVHQGDYSDGIEYKKGVYHINLVDEVTQWEIAGSVEAISEQFLVPLLRHLIEQFPFRIINFHSDNGSEYINKTVAYLLNKLFIEQTKSRPRHSNDNGLVETKNGSVIRKHMGYVYIEQRHAKRINLFYATYLNPYLNFHRPSGFPTRVEDTKKKGKYKNVYHNYLTPFEKVKTLKNPGQYLKIDVTMPLLERFAQQMSDNEAASTMQTAKRELLREIRNK